MTERRSRRWFQLSLKSLFGLMLLVATFFAGYTLRGKQADAQRWAEFRAKYLEAIPQREFRIVGRPSVAKMTAMPRNIYSLHLDCEREPGGPITR